MNYDIQILDRILSELYQGVFNREIDGNDLYGLLPSIALRCINDEYESNINQDIMKKLITISNILYNNTNLELLPIEDGIYDLLVEKYNKIDRYLIGSPEIDIKVSEEVIHSNPEPQEIIYFNPEVILFNSFKYHSKKLYPKPIEIYDIKEDSDNYITKRLNVVSHDYPELVGSLTKCKFVLDKDAQERGLYDDPKIRIFERDFMGDHIMKGIINPNETLGIMMELKYDGVSIEATVSNRILSARTRGDVDNNKASDLTPIFRDYVFPKAIGVIPDNQIFGIKFEAIMTNDNLRKFNQIMNKNYANCRTAIIGLLSNSDAYKYRDLITLIPLATSLPCHRLIEADFLNKYYTRDELLRYDVNYGNYLQNLYVIRSFVQEAEKYRPYAPFMYDGVVISYMDDFVIKALGRSNNINNYSTAIKFNPPVKYTTFRGYSYTVGQNGTITPMIHYDPIEFYGGIHTKSSGHSYERFKTLNLSIGDRIRVEYVNDVMPYVYSTNSSINKPVPFPDNCPVCGTPIQISPSGKSAYCTNINCNGIRSAVLVNMVSKLGFKDIGEATVLELNLYSFSQLMELNESILSNTTLGPKTREKILSQIEEFKIKPIPDYVLLGSLGFPNISNGKWKIILSTISIQELIDLYKEPINNPMMNNQIIYRLKLIKGIGEGIAYTIQEYMPVYINELEYISRMGNIMHSKYAKNRKKIRFTGFRDSELSSYLTSLGHDAGEGSITKDTDILLVPFENYISSKVHQANKYASRVIDVNEFKENMIKYL